MSALIRLVFILILAGLCALPSYCELSSEEELPNYDLILEKGNGKEAVREKRSFKSVNDQDIPQAKIRKSKISLEEELNNSNLVGSKTEKREYIGKKEIYSKPLKVDKEKPKMFKPAEIKGGRADPAGQRNVEKHKQKPYIQAKSNIKNSKKKLNTKKRKTLLDNVNLENKKSPNPQEKTSATNKLKTKEEYSSNIEINDIKSFKNTTSKVSQNIRKDQNSDGSRVGKFEEDYETCADYETEQQELKKEPDLPKKAKSSDAKTAPGEKISRRVAYLVFHTK